MSLESREKTCPFCGNPNLCGVGAIEGCWCAKTVIPRELVELLPADAKSCICAGCVSAYQRDPEAFVRLNRTAPI